MERVIVVVSNSSQFKFSLLQQDLKALSEDCFIPHAECGEQEGHAIFPMWLLLEWGIGYQDVLFISDWCHRAKANKKLKGLIYKLIDGKLNEQSIN